MSAQTLEPVLETVEAPAEDSNPSKMLHGYCGACLMDLYPQRILPHCGTNRPRNEDEMLGLLRTLPPEDLCVVCLDTKHCRTCGGLQ